MKALLRTNELIVPDGLGDLSTYMLDKAVEHLDQKLASADEETRRAIEVVKLVTRIPRRSPWYGVPADPDDNSVTAGVVVRNLLEYSSYERRARDLLERGRQAYHDYLDHLFDPVRHAQEEASRLNEEQAQAQRLRFAPWA